MPDLDAALDDDIGDDLLRLVFTACHPVLSTEARVALTLRLLGGLTTDEIARAFLVPEPTIAQRIVRAKRTLAEARVPFEVPRGDELRRAAGVGARGDLPRLQRGLLGDRRRRLDAARRCARTRCASAASWPSWRRDEPEVHGLVALMEIQASRSRARVGPIGRADPAARPEPRALGPAADPPRAGGARARRSSWAARSGRTRCRPRSPPATRARARAEETDWARIAALYDALAELTPSPVVELNRAVAVAMAFGPAAGLELVDALTAEPSLKSYHLLPSVRGDLLAKLGRFDEARAEFERAAALTQNARERTLLLERAAGCG